MQRWICLFVLLEFLFFIPCAVADMGAIVPAGEVHVTETAQKAIVAHDGFEELLILATDLSSTRQTMALRFIPFPSEPHVSLAPEDCFQNLEKLLEKYRIRYLIKLKGELSRPSAVEVLSHQRLGSHDLTTVCIRDVSGFSEWVNSYFKNHGLQERSLSRKEIETVEDYVNRDIRYFVFDQVELDQTVKSVRPVQFSFQTRELFYPLVASNLFQGKGKIQLFVLSERGEFQEKLASYRHMRMKRMVSFWRYSSNTEVVTGSDLRSISPELAGLLGNHAVLQVFEYDGAMDFRSDLVVPLRSHSHGAKPGARRFNK